MQIVVIIVQDSQILKALNSAQSVEHKIQHQQTSAVDVAKLYEYDKKEYLKNRYKRDFLQYILLQEDSLSV